MLVNNRNYRTVWMENSSVFMIDQLKLPFRFEIFESKGYKTTSKAIKDMVIRGAPAIGAAACYAYAQSVINFKGREIEHLQKEMEGAEKLIKSARPTANDLFYAVNFLKEKLVECKNVDDAKKDALKFSNEYADLSSEQCRKIGIHGNGLIKQNQKILTHCNAGALACVDYGTALSPIRAAHHGGKNIFVYADETRPRSQGARLTAFELCSEK
ncbi:MAG TPA: S-methyl-5-thioribose-1-phosphate isomerase, partial [Candidatus Nanoarchaeia archaeon]|nr:S-methyl-5-thioribose-1-phosphate isomerase [Candidatus Nanoarchaeia archaeon]